MGDLAMKHLKKNKGVSAVEFAIVLPILMIITFGIIEFGLLLFDKQVITNASREGARAGIVARFDPNTGEPNPLSNGEINAIVNNYVGNHLVSLGGATTPNTLVTRNGNDLTVTINYNYSFLVLPKFVTSLTGNINLVAATVMRMEIT
jgi:Flp pilus assembly protein TadG